jgi:LAGLIDADG DNA endonuclease family
VKIVPTNIIYLVNPIVLAYLIMTDGNFDKSRNRIRIYTNSLKKYEVQNLALAINNKLGIYTGVLHDRKDQWILTIGAKNLELLRNTVSPHFHSSMLYRIGM